MSETPEQMAERLDLMCGKIVYATHQIRLLPQRQAECEALTAGAAALREVAQVRAQNAELHEAVKVASEEAFDAECELAMLRAERDAAWSDAWDEAVRVWHRWRDGLPIGGFSHSDGLKFLAMVEEARKP